MQETKSTRKWALALMSYKEIGAIAKDQALLMVPIGCVEQHGPAGFTGADTILADYVCRQTAQAFDWIYVTPPIWYGYTPYTSFPGTVGLRLETLSCLVHDVVEGYVNHGFRHIVIVNNHGPNEPAIEPVAAKMRREHRVILSMLYPWRLVSHVASRRPQAPARMGHGGDPTISVMMALSPGAVKLNQPDQYGYVSPSGPFKIVSLRSARFEEFEVGLFSDPSLVLPSGASGDWSTASEERGREILDQVIAYTRQFVKAFMRFSQASQQG